MNIILIAWEIPIFNSIQGKALSRRVGQLIKRLAERGHTLTIIHRDQLEEIEEGGLRKENWVCFNQSFVRYVTKESRSKVPMSFSFLRTYYHLLTCGDWTGIWANQTFRLLKDLDLRPDAIISFFTPRGPLLLGKLLAGYYHVPYFFDFQDTWDEGLRWDQKLFSLHWMRKIVKNANGLIHVSPEWSTRDGRKLKSAFHTLRHAVNLQKNKIHSIGLKSEFRIFYGGSIDFENQDINAFLSSVNELPLINNITFVYAGPENVAQKLRNSITRIKFEYLGWLDDTNFDIAVEKSSVLLILGWKSPGRKVVPSKLYHYMSFNKPILLAGKDSGALEQILMEWEHSLCIIVSNLTDVLIEGVESNFSNFLLPPDCKNIFTEINLAEKYESIVSNAVNFKLT